VCPGGGRTRDARGFDEFYQGTRERLVAYLYAVGGDLSEAQDAAQEAYARAWERWSQLAASADPEAWVRTVSWRVLAHRWRSLRSRRRADRSHRVSPVAQTPTEDVVDLVAALRGLPLGQRQMLVLHHVLDVPVAQVAAETGLPAGTVKARLARGRAALAAMLGTDMREADHA
jgi:RNA polymerase sigma-70 factor (ECF subfamily)